MSISPFEHPFLSGLFADPEIAALLSAQADIGEMLRFEAALAQAQAALDIIPGEAATAIAQAVAAFTPDMDALAQGVSRDGVVIPALVRQLRAVLPEQYRAHLHFGVTSQDVIDSSLIIRFKAIVAILDARLEGLIAALDSLAARFGTNPLMARTRMQDALPIVVADRLADWKLPLIRHRQRLAELLPRLLVVQLGGPVGTADAFGAQAGTLAAGLATALGLQAPDKAWHSQRDTLVEFAAWLALVSGSLGKVGQDVALMAQNAVADIALAGGGGSSAMAHKSNPVAAEVLVSLARHNATLVSGATQSLIHEHERSGSAWTLEWLTLPQMAHTTGSGLLLAQRLLTSVKRIGSQA